MQPMNTISCGKFFSSLVFIKGRHLEWQLRKNEMELGAKEKRMLKKVRIGDVAMDNNSGTEINLNILSYISDLSYNKHFNTPTVH